MPDTEKKKKRASQTYNERYTDEVQKLYLNMLLSDPEAFAICRSILNEDYFDDRLRSAVTFILEYADQERRLPAVEQVKAYTGVALEKFSEGSLHTDYILKEIEGFCQYKAMEIAVLDGVELLQTGRAGEIVERTKQAMTISLMSDLGTNYFEDPETRLKRMLDKSAYVSTGWAELDKKLYGGFTRGGLNVFPGSSGSGKSLFLQNLAINWAMLGYTVLYISLELSEDLVSVRLDAMITGRGTSECLRDVGETVMRIRGAQKLKKPGLIYVKKLPEGGTTCNTIRAYIKEFQIKTGLKPDALLIDYLDLMYPNNGRIDPSDQFIKDKYVSEEIRGLMHETNMFGATASQLNRQAVEATSYDHSHIAGGISKINTADNVMAIISNIGMKEKGIYKLQFLKTRSSSATGQTIELSYDPTSMRITDAMIQEDVDTPLSKDNLRKLMNPDEGKQSVVIGPAKMMITPNSLSEDQSEEGAMPHLESTIDRLRKRTGSARL